MKFLNGVGWFLLLFVRGALLWVLVPFSFLAWVSIHWWWQKASLRQALSWYDSNMIAGLTNGPFRFLMRPGPRPRLTGMSKMALTEPHTITLLDFN